jgi:hypothetical protein
MLVARSRRDRALWELALDIPLAVALDFVALMLLARIMTLETAALVSRPLWVAGAAAWIVRSRRRGTLAWPHALGKREMISVGLTVMLSVALSVSVSRDCHSFDRGWHIPLATSLRGQTVPFANVYQPGTPFPYHFAGDVLGATLQTLSGVYIHMSTALSLSHDLLFGLIGAMLALLLCALGSRSPVPLAVLAQAPLLAGPATLLVSSQRLDAGYTFISLYKVSFRPHLALALLLMIGFFVAVVARLRWRTAATSIWTTAPVLIVTTGALSVTDEASIGLLGLCIGVTWLAFPGVLAERRVRGALILAAMLATLVLANVLFNGALFAGVGQTVAWVPGRAPGYSRTPLSLDGAAGRLALARDLLPTLAVWLGGLVALLRGLRREHLGSMTFLSPLLIVSVIALTHVDLGERSVESHRFMTAALALLPVGAFFWLFPTPGARTPPRDLGLASALMLAGMSLGAASSLDWWVRQGDPGSHDCIQSSRYFARRDLFGVDCREFVGAHFGERPEPTYLDRAIAYTVAGCRPLFTAGPPVPRVRSDRIDLPKRGLVKQWDTKIGGMLLEGRALHEIAQNLAPPGQPLKLACARPSQDPVCAYARLRRTCKRTGSVDECWIASSERAAVMTNAGHVPVDPSSVVE